MFNRLRRTLAIASAALLLSTTAAAQSMAENDAANTPVAVDAMFLRPLGVIGLVLGTGFFLATAPIVLVTRPQEIGKLSKVLVVKPVKFLWVDPLGGH